jgi:hypothetical protein
VPLELHSPRRGEDFGPPFLRAAVNLLLPPPIPGSIKPSLAAPSTQAPCASSAGLQGRPLALPLAAGIDLF